MKIAIGIAALLLVLRAVREFWAIYLSWLATAVEEDD